MDRTSVSEEEEFESPAHQRSIVWQTRYSNYRFTVTGDDPETVYEKAVQLACAHGWKPPSRGPIASRLSSLLWTWRIWSRRVQGIRLRRKLGRFLKSAWPRLVRARLRTQRKMVFASRRSRAKTVLASHRVWARLVETGLIARWRMRRWGRWVVKRLTGAGKPR